MSYPIWQVRIIVALKNLKREASQAPAREYRDGYLDALREAIEIAEEEEADG